MFTKQFWLETFERATKTGAQFVIGAWGLGDQIANVFEFDWMIGLGSFGGGFILSVLTSIASAPLSKSDTPSLV